MLNKIPREDLEALVKEHASKASALSIEVDKLRADVKRFRLPVESPSPMSYDTIRLAIEWLKDDIDGANEHDPAVGINSDPDLAALFGMVQDWLREHLPAPDTDGKGQ